MIYEITTPSGEVVYKGSAKSTAEVVGTTVHNVKYHLEYKKKDGKKKYSVDINGFNILKKKG